MRHGDRDRGWERGEVSLRIVVVAALFAGLVWTVPMVVFGREATRYAGDLTGGAPSGEDGGDGGAGAPVDPIGRANDAQAQAALNNAIRVAQIYYAENGSYAGFGPEVAAEYDPTVTFTLGPVGPGVVSMRGIGPGSVVLVTATARGDVLCAAAQDDVVSFGRANATSPAQCRGGWG